MDLLKRILNLAALVLIAIGDFVLLLFRGPMDIFGGREFSPKKKKIKQGTFKLPKKKNNPLSLYIYLTFILRPIKLTFKFFKKTIYIIIADILAVILFPVRVFDPIRINYRSYQLKKLTQKKRLSRNKNHVLKPSLFYKLKYVFIGALFSFVFFFVPLLTFLFVSELPNPGNLSINYIPKTTKIYDRNGTLLYEIYANQNRTIVRLSDIPKQLQEATIAIEDKEFYNHPGFDLRGIVRAFVTNVKKEGFQGGSTITQQLIKSAFLTPEPTIIRKVKEIALAFWAERVYTKDEILELYLNYVPYGGTAWGIQAAADVYFGKKVKDLTLAESAFLAGLPQAPSVYSPYFGNGNLWKTRQKEVLDTMTKLGYITAEQSKKAYEEELSFKNPQVPLKAPHFVMYVRNYLIEKYGINEVERGGLQVYTSLDLSTQETAEKIVSEEVNADSSLNIGNGAALITNPKNGDILAMVGSKNYFDQSSDGNVNLTTSLRQPGSSIKLVTYTLALTHGYTEATILDDTPLTIADQWGNSFTPVNYDGAFHGRIPLRIAFGNSFNIPPVRLAQKFGPDAIKDFGEKMGISSWSNAKNYGVSITLGGVEVRMTDLATIYGTIANEGKRIDLNPLVELKDSDNKDIYKKDDHGTQVVDPGIAFIISDILSDSKARMIEFGLNTPLIIPGRRVSVKTGTTDEKRDNWTIGFTPDLLVATWVGNNDNTPMNQALASGITGAAPMWNRIMASMLAKTSTPSALIIPSDIVKKYCAGQDRYFVKGTESSVSCAAPPPITSPSITPSN